MKWWLRSLSLPQTMPCHTIPCYAGYAQRERGSERSRKWKWGKEGRAARAAAKAEVEQNEITTRRMAPGEELEWKGKAGQHQKQPAEMEPGGRRSEKEKFSGRRRRRHQLLSLFCKLHPFSLRLFVLCWLFSQLLLLSFPRPPPPPPPRPPDAADKAEEAPKPFREKSERLKQFAAGTGLTTLEFALDGSGAQLRGDTFLAT